MVVALQTGGQVAGSREEGLRQVETNIWQRKPREPQQQSGNGMCYAVIKRFVRVRGVTYSMPD